MNIQTIAEHKVDLDLLPQKANVLDLGCRGFLMADELRRLGHRVFPIDIDNLGRSDYFRVAITDTIGYKEVIKTKDPQATHTATPYFDRNIQSSYSLDNNDLVYGLTLELFSDIVNILFWDLIKIDVEGDERGIIKSLRRPMAKQISVEFHLHTGIYGEKQVDDMVKKLESLGYKIASHEKTSQHGCGLNYWSSLFILQ
jgi:hypothetical protein